MGAALLLLGLALACLCPLPTGGVHDAADEDYAYYDYTEDPSTTSDYDLSWLTELFDVLDECEPNPCLNNGACENLVDGGYKCSCPRPYKGKQCEATEDPCKKAKCGRGECVLTQTAPFYECKCDPPFQGPDCRKASRCKPNPCLNGGTCKKGRTRNKFECVCPAGYSGKLCQVGNASTCTALHSYLTGDVKGTVCRILAKTGTAILQSLQNTVVVYPLSLPPESKLATRMPKHY